MNSKIKLWLNSTQRERRQIEGIAEFTLIVSLLIGIVACFAVIFGGF